MKTEFVASYKTYRALTESYVTGHTDDDIDYCLVTRFTFNSEEVLAYTYIYSPPLFSTPTEQFFDSKQVALITTTRKHETDIGPFYSLELEIEDEENIPIVRSLLNFLAIKLFKTQETV